MLGNSWLGVFPLFLFSASLWLSLTKRKLEKNCQEKMLWLGHNSNVCSLFMAQLGVALPFKLFHVSAFSVMASTTRFDKNWRWIVECQLDMGLMRMLRFQLLIHSSNLPLKPFPPSLSPSVKNSVILFSFTHPNHVWLFN